MSKKEKELIRKIMVQLKYEYHRETKGKLAQRMERIWDICYGYANGSRTAEGGPQ